MNYNGLLAITITTVLIRSKEKLRKFKNIPPFTLRIGSDKPLSTLHRSALIMSLFSLTRWYCGAGVTCPHGNVHDVGSNPAATRNENQTLGTPLQKVAQWSGQDLSGRLAM